MGTDSAINNQVISANVEFYKEIAAKYDSYEACASDAFYQCSLEQDLEAINTKLAQHTRPIRCLDCGGGTGNLTLKMLKRGWKVTVVDVSSDMLRILKTKMNSSGYKAAFINDSVENYFFRSREQFDVIAFSSVLHHLYSPLDVVKEAAERIRPGGFFYSIFDPVPPSSKFAAAFVGSLDTLLAKIVYDRKDLLPGIARRFRKLSTARDTIHGRPVVSAGDLAEYHARTGINDKLIVRTLEESGFSVDRTHSPVGRTAVMRWANRHLNALLSFRVLARRSYASEGIGRT
jgi:2-polyprenyl-3-methyl-5-hydroxy-6-metoxy-1,4-benzoquinol methylase